MPPYRRVWWGRAPLRGGRHLTPQDVVVGARSTPRGRNYITVILPCQPPVCGDGRTVGNGPCGPLGAQPCGRQSAGGGGGGGGSGWLRASTSRSKSPGPSKLL